MPHPTPLMPRRARQLLTHGALSIALLTPSVALAAKPKDTVDKDLVLKHYTASSAALQRGDYAEAKARLDAAISAIGGVMVDEAGAKKARSLWSNESAKLFIGEPYERVMAYTYRGMLYWMDGEYDNARACFRSGQFTDADAEAKTYASDYVLLDYLDGLATAKLGGDGTDALQRATKLSNQPPPNYDTKINTLIFMEFGHGPTKVAAGKHQELLKVQTGHSPITSAVVKVGDQQAGLCACDDLNFQATTRGGRVMDGVLGNKAVFKDNTGAAGDLALRGAMNSARNGGGGDLTKGLAIGGALLKGASFMTKTKADTRAWAQLPAHLGVVLLQLPPGRHVACIEFLDSAGKLVSKRDVTITVAAEKPDTVVFVSERTS